MENFQLVLTFDQFGDTIIGVNTEEFSPHIVVAMLEHAKTKMVAQMSMNAMQARAEHEQRNPSLLIPQSDLLLAR